MAKIGANCPVFAPVETDTSEGISYGAGVILGKFINCDINHNFAEGSLFGDNVLCEYVKEYRDTDITLGVTYLPTEADIVVFGKTVNGNETTSNIEDEPAEGGFGYITKELRDSVAFWIVFWQYRTKFSTPNRSGATKADNITFNTPSITGKGKANANGDYESKWEFSTPEAALAKLFELANIESDPVVNAPIIFPLASKISASTQIQLACATKDAKIYYTTDGAIPDTSAQEYTAPFTLSATATVKAVAVVGGVSSKVKTMRYTII